MIICVTAFLYVTVNAQDFYNAFRAKSIDVDGMKIGQVLDYSHLLPNLDCPISMRSRVPMAVITKLLKLTKKVSAILSFAMVAISAVLLFLTIRFLH